MVFPNYFTFHNQKFKCSIILQASEFFCFLLCYYKHGWCLFYKCVVLLNMFWQLFQWWTDAGLKTFQNINLLKLNKGDLAKWEGFCIVLSSWKVYWSLACHGPRLAIHYACVWIMFFYFSFKNWQQIGLLPCI